MASRQQTEENPMPDERAPLLANDDVQYVTDLPPSEGDPILDSPKAASKKWQYAWRTFFVVATILVVAVFVKGWMDADDVNVSASARRILRVEN
jgi:hypothetical protein